MTKEPGAPFLGSKRSDLVAVVAPLCIKGLRLVTVQLPEKFLGHRTAAMVASTLALGSYSGSVSGTGD